MLVEPHTSRKVKAMRKTLQVLALTLAVSASAYAGEMQFPVTDPPPQSSATATQQPTTDGNMQNDAAANLTQIALDLLAVLPSLP
jgi:hypothetical protein